MSNKIISEYNLLENYYLEDVFDYFKPLSKEEAEEYLDRLYKKNSRRMRNKFLYSFLYCMKRGIEEQSLILVLCTSNVFKAFLKRMTSSVLLPFAGFDAVKNIIEKQREESDALHIGGYFNPDENLVFLVIENSEEELKDRGEDQLYVLHHELCHYTAANHNRDFQRLFRKKYLEPFYNKMFENFYKLARKKPTSDEIDTLTKVLLDNLLEREIISTTKSTSAREEKNYVNKCFKELKEIDNEIGEIWGILVNDSFTIKKYQNIVLKLIYSTYTENGWNIPQMFLHYQELIFPSEIICVLAIILKEEPEFIEMLDLLFR
jgi:hypothetical protein